MYLLCDAGSTTATPPAFKVMQIGNSAGSDFFKIRFAVLPNGRITQAALPNAPADADFAQNGLISLYLDESNNKLMVKARYSNGTIKSGQIATLS